MKRTAIIQSSGQVYKLLI